MKKIVPFNNVLDFSTDVSEISAISLEHDINIQDDIISGSFYITGEYKITDGDIKRESFNFELPFDIAVSQKYDLDTLVVDIDDFRYEVIDRNKLKVNIDLFIDGDIIMDEDRTEVLDMVEDSLLSSDYEVVNEEDSLEEGTYQTEEDDITLIEPRIDLLDDLLIGEDEEEIVEDSKEKNIINNNETVNNNDIDNENSNTVDNDSGSFDNNEVVFNGIDGDDKYVTYRVYRVMERDSIDSILEKYHITKEELANYNPIEDIKPGDKLIIPSND